MTILQHMLSRDDLLYEDIVALMSDFLLGGADTVSIKLEHGPMNICWYISDESSSPEYFQSIFDVGRGLEECPSRVADEYEDRYWVIIRN